MTLIKHKPHTEDVKISQSGVSFVLRDQRECQIREVRIQDNVSASAWAGANVWEPAVLLSRFLDCPSFFPPSFWNNKRIVELGAGMGLAGMVGAMLGAEVYLTDMKMALPFLEGNVETNQSQMRVPATVAELQWGPHRSLTTMLERCAPPVQTDISPLVTPPSQTDLKLADLTDDAIADQADDQNAHQTDGKEEQGGVDFILAAECLYIGQQVPHFLHTAARLCRGFDEDKEYTDNKDGTEMSVEEIVQSGQTVVVVCGIIGSNTLEAFVEQAAELFTVRRVPGMTRLNCVTQDEYPETRSIYLLTLRR